MLGRCFYSLYKKIETKEHRLLYLFFEITRQCNLNCLHCGSDCTNTAVTQELGLSDWINILDDLKANNSKLPFIVLTGGEPLLCPFLHELGLAMKHRGFAWGLVSNGWLLDNKRMLELRASGCRALTLSLDGNADSHDYLRGRKSSYKHVINAAKSAASTGLAFYDIVTCVYPGNIGELDQLAETLIKLKVPAWRLFRIFPSGRAAQNSALQLDSKLSRSLVDWIRDKRPIYASRGLDVSFSCEGYLPFSLDKKVRSMPFFCRSGINFASVLCDGNVTGCSNNAPAFYQGNILQNKLSQIWESQFDVYRNKSWLYNTECATCSEIKNAMADPCTIGNR